MEEGAGGRRVGLPTSRTPLFSLLPAHPHHPTLSETSALEEVLLSALRDKRRAILELEAQAKTVKAALARENRQFERLQFALKTAASDGAMSRSMAKLRARDQERIKELEARLAETGGE